MEEAILFPHQRTTIDWVVKKCKSQHGLVISHYMGTGKTKTALQIAKQYKYNKILIILPDGLQSQWIDEIKNNDIDTKDVTLLSYYDLVKIVVKDKTLNKLLDNVFVIMDEAHNILNAINVMAYRTKENDYFFKKEQVADFSYSKTFKDEPNDNDYVVRFIFALQRAAKVIMLTGTPFYNDISDIRYLINIAAGKPVVPFDKAEFDRKFIYKPFKVTTAINWLNPAIDFLTNFTPFGGKVRFLYAKFLQGDLKNVKANDVLKNLEILRKIVEYNFTNTDTNNTKQTNSNEENLVKNMKPEVYASIVKLQRKVKNKTITNKILQNDKQNEYLKKYTDTILDTVKNISTETTKNFALMFIADKTSELYNLYLTDDRLNASKIKPFGKYFSYYKYYEDINLFPTFRHKTHNVLYTNDQIDIFLSALRGDFNTLTDEEFVDFKIVKAKEKIDFEKGYKKRWINFTSQGLIIGNMSRTQNVYPNKFKELLKVILETNEKSIVYSSFYNGGIKKLSDFLNIFKIYHKIYSPSTSIDELHQIKEEFENGALNILLLHPVFFEGFSVKNCRHLHILEPIGSFPKYQQLTTRVIRLHSHSSLPKSQRNVLIHTWVCKIDRIRQGGIVLAKDIKKWFNNNLNEFYLTHINSGTGMFKTPDVLVNSNFNIAKRQDELLYNILKEISIENEPEC